MNMKAGLFQQQSLKLTMTKELTQAITLLQYSSLELSEFLQEQALENPLIEIKEIQTSSYEKKKTTITKAEKSNPLDYLVKNDKTLHQHLSEQMMDFNLSPFERTVADYIIDLIDNNGYLTLTSSDISELLSIDEALIETHIFRIQSFEPAGVGASNLQQCLLIQLERFENRNPLAELIIRDHFDIFASKSWKEIAKKIKVELSQIQAVSDLVVTLNPRPGSVFLEAKPKYIVPDLTVMVSNDLIKVDTHDEYLPQLSLNLQYYNKIASEQDTTTKAYLQEKAQQCQWILKSLDQRKQTMFNVMNEIIIRQPDFFKKGSAFLKPLTMKEIAEALEIHESTVSRACRDKYVQTPFGIVEMKTFFSSGIQTANSIDETSSAGVKQLIEQIVSKESKKKPLSDQKIVKKLEEEHDIIVSRRTIAKYRDQLGILSSSLRKRYD